MRFLTTSLRRYSTTRFPEDAILHEKPKLSQFKYPLYNTFLIASSVYIFLNVVWYRLEHDEREAALTSSTKQLEDEIQQLVNSKKEELDEIVKKNRKSWWKIW